MSPSCSEPKGVVAKSGPEAETSGSCSGKKAVPPGCAIGTVMTPAGPVYRVSTTWSRSDHIGRIRCRISPLRNRYKVEPGLYAVGEPGKDSPVLVSANYKLSFDVLRRDLVGLDAWILVLDTKGINVWCAAGKGTFGTDELVRSISCVNLDKIVGHRRIVVPQLGGPGISAHKVRERSGFMVYYGPVDSRDIPAFLEAGCKASARMRSIEFTFTKRLVLTPMEIIPAIRYFPLYLLFILFFFGLQPSGILLKDAWSGGFPFILLGLISILAGAFVTPALLPFIPFRSFALKGWVAGLASVCLVLNIIPVFYHLNGALLVSVYIFFPLVSSYLALRFTGATTFTGPSGVKRELKLAVPIYLGSTAVSVLLLVLFKLGEWRVI